MASVMDVGYGTCGRVESLARCSLLKVLDNLATLIENVSNLPSTLKARILYLMQKRGLVSDENLPKVVTKLVTKLDLSESEVSNAALAVIASSCPWLHSIDLNAGKTCRTAISTQGVVNLAMGCRHLHVVYLRRCVNIGDAAVIALASNCPQLTDLNIGGCTLVTDASLQALAQHSSQLASINFSHADITDSGVIHLAQGVCANSLQEVHVDGCQRITDDAVEALTYFCQRINILIFHGCPNITDRSRVALEQGVQSSMRQLTWTVY